MAWHQEGEVRHDGWYMCIIMGFIKVITIISSWLIMRIMIIGDNN